MTETVDEYRLGARIASDSVIRTYSAVVRGAGGGEREVLLRIAELPGLDRDLRARFEDDARAAKALTHDHVVPLDGFGTHDGAPYVAFGSIAAKTLRELLDAAPEHRLPHAEVARIGLDIASALEHAHGREPAIVHRAVSPAAIVIDAEGVARVSDYALAGLVVAAASVNTALLQHTCRYGSPEQAKNKKSGAPSDVFALGATLYEALAGAPAYDGPTPLAIVLKISMGTLPSMSALPKDTPAALAAILRRMLVADPNDRATARDVVLALEELVGRDRSARAALGRRAFGDRPREALPPRASSPRPDEFIEDPTDAQAEAYSPRDTMPPASPALDFTSHAGPAVAEPPPPARARPEPPMIAPVAPQPAPFAYDDVLFTTAMPDVADPSMPDVTDPSMPLPELRYLDDDELSTQLNALNPETLELESEPVREWVVEPTKVMTAPAPPLMPDEPRPTRPMVAAPALQPFASTLGPTPSSDGPRRPIGPIVIVVALGVGAISLVAVVAALTAWLAS